MNLPHGAGRISVSLVDQNAAIAQLRHAFVYNRQMHPGARRTIDVELEAEAIYATNAIEGSSLTEMETAAVIESGITCCAIPFRDFAAAVGDAEALREARRLAASGRDLVASDVGHLISILQQLERPWISNQYGRQGRERLARTITLSPGDAAEMAEWCSRLLNSRSGVREAFEAHFDVAVRSRAGPLAGRLARLLLNFLLAREGFPPIVIGTRWHAEYRQWTTAHSEERRGSTGKDIAYQHFMGARLVQTLERALGRCERLARTTARG